MNSHLNTLLIASLASFPLLCSSGCSEHSKNAANVQGTVTIDGELASSGTVVFHSLDDHPTSYGSIRKDGSFALQVGQGNKANPDYNDIPLGEYVATVTIRGESYEDPNQSPGSPPQAGPLLIAKRYTSRATSPLRYKVSAEPKPFVVSLEVEAPDPSDEDGAADSAEEVLVEAGTEDTEPAETENEAEAEPTQAESSGPSETEQAVQDILSNAQSTEAKNQQDTNSEESE